LPKRSRLFPVGFRAPHFGYFQAPEQREVLYSVLRELNYEYSTSTLPDMDSAWPGGEREWDQRIPLSGSYVDPFTILDSWNYVVSPSKPELKPQYADLFMQTVDKL